MGSGAAVSVDVAFWGFGIARLPKCAFGRGGKVGGLGGGCFHSGGAPPSHSLVRWRLSVVRR